MNNNCSINTTDYHSRGHLYLFGYANIVFSVIGTFFNLSVMMVYSQKHMTSPMHTIIAHLAATDVLTAVAYIPHSWQELIRANYNITIKTIVEHRTENWEQCSFYSWHLTATFTHISSLLVVMLGVWRYIGIIHPLRERSWCNTRNTRIIIVVCYILGILASIPAFLGTSVAKESICRNGTNITIHQLRIMDREDDLTFKATFLFYGILLKTLPSVALTTISCRLILALHQAKLRHEQLTRNTSTLSNESNRRFTRKRKQTIQITKMLLIVLGLFVTGELPHGIFCSLTAIYGTEFYYKYYYNLSEIFNTVNNFCSCTYFLVYYNMSNKFRNTFKVLIKCQEPSPLMYQNTFASCNANTINQCTNDVVIRSFP
ncbi:sex peptide receptor-related protein 2-like [Planococcus citri]|uniref:sex peptide receptor-related protein 2-like n=1 Tax=Planococcus citri TaxID=170843 RepID=UPI0031F9D082